MRYSFLPHVEDYDNPDEYVKDLLFLPSDSGRSGKLMDLRRWAALLGVKGVMSLKREELLLLIADRVGWERISFELSNVGVLKKSFLSLGISESEFRKMRESHEIRDNGMYVYTRRGKRTMSHLYSVYDYFRIKNKWRSADDD